jgi:signal transduction histidine kinase/streptogramin lyase
MARNLLRRNPFSSLLNLRFLVGWTIVCALVCLPAFSLDLDRSIAQLHYTFWSEKDGAPSPITALAQTQDGYIWIGSERGLFRFDGVRFEKYKPQLGVELPVHGIYSLTATPDGGLWIAFTPDGLGFWKDGYLTVFKKPEERPDSPVHCLVRDHAGRIWAGTETGLALRQGARWIKVGRDWNFTPEMIRYLLVDREGTLWVATITTIVFLKPDSRRFELGGPIGSGVTTLAQAKDGRVWLADAASYQVRPVPSTGHDLYREGPSIVEMGLYVLLFDRDGALWITRLDSGIVRVRHPEKLRNHKYDSHDPEVDSFDTSHGFPAGLAYFLLEDREGNIWVGCSNGLIRFRHNDVVPVHLSPRYEKITLLAGNDGDLWVGTVHESPLLHIHNESLLPEKVGERVSSVLRASNGNIWWGARTGLWRQRDTKFDFSPLPKGVTPDWIYGITPSRDDDGLWIRFGDVGWVHFNRGVWDLHDRPRGVPSAGTFGYGFSAAYRDALGRTWFGYDSGHVCLIDGQQVTVFSQNDGLDLGRIKVIRGLGEQIWVGGELGLMLFSKGRFLKVRGSGGERLGAISGIIETSDSGLWLNEMTGIVHIPAEEISRFVANPNHPVNYRRFDYLDGLPGTAQLSFTSSTAVQTSNGRLWFATDNGLVWVDPAHLVKNVLPPPVSIRSIIADDKIYSAFSSPALPALTKNLRIDFAALSLSIPERIRFRYKLEPLDKDWQDTGGRSEASFNRLPPGKYSFRVIACNNDGVWNEQGAGLDFSIDPAWYQTRWFQAAYVAAFLLLLWGLYRFRTHQMSQKFKLRLEERVSERTRIARELLDTLLQSFQGLMLRLEAVNVMLPEGRPKEQLEQTLEHADQAVTEGRRAVYDLRSCALTTNELPQAVALGNELASQDTAAFSLMVEGPARDLHPIIRDELYRITREALQNAFNHARARHIEVEITYAQRQLRLRIRDDGEGIAPEILEHGRAGHYGLAGYVSVPNKSVRS